MKISEEDMKALADEIKRLKKIQEEDKILVEAATILLSRSKVPPWESTFVVRHVNGVRVRCTMKAEFHW